MDLQAFLKKIKLNENNISMILGALILVVIGVIVINYFKSLEPTDTLPTGVSTETTDQVKLPTKHTVAAGETLWSIAEKYFKSGYNWVDIQTANKLTNASVITKGQELIIPDVQAKTATVTPGAIAKATTAPVVTPKATASTQVDDEATVSATTKGGLPIVSSTTKATTGMSKITGESYTIMHGDSLWKIAERAYGDGHAWVKIAKANKLSHPGTIHTGNVLTLPR
ncbi:LysM peptidoglycan-binding domain-containing protein [Candidatus Woesebacteria bacterium]|nr:LysM peptidoglycan-binding domain-containing protein [Candidatus Woesebacteria bacterium]